MKKLVVFNICIVLLYLCILVSLTAAEIGISSCRYLGEMEEDGKKCREDVVKIKRLPKTCTSFVYDGIIYVPNYHIEFKDVMYGLERLGTLIDFEDRSHQVYLFFSHGSLIDWHTVLLKGDSPVIARNVKDFIAYVPVKGLILNDIDYPYSEIDGDFYEAFATYVMNFKANTSLEIGLYMSARIFIENESIGISLPNSRPPWFNFIEMNKIIDFYVIEFATLNVCCTDLLHRGITPMESSNPEIMTLNDFAAVLEISTIAKDKLYFEFLISPKPFPDVVENYVPCEISYNEYCENESNQLNTWCVDDSDILYKKGAFTKKYAKGFIGRNIDLVDRDNNCDCGKYMAFDMMVNGFNGEADPKNCKPLGGS